MKCDCCGRLLPFGLKEYRGTLRLADRFPGAKDQDVTLKLCSTCGPARHGRFVPTHFAVTNIRERSK